MCALNNISFSDIAQTLVALASLVISILAYNLAKKISFKKLLRTNSLMLLVNLFNHFHHHYFQYPGKLKTVAEALLFSIWRT